MADADPALPIDGLVPVGVAGHRGAERGQQTDEDRDVGGRDPTVASSDDVAEVEEDRDGPGADGDVRQDGVERMTEPGAVEKGLEGMAGTAESLVKATDQLLEDVGHGLQPALPVDEAVDDVIEHARLLSSGRAR